MASFLEGMDYEAHNAQVREVWDSYGSGAPVRVPIIFGVSTRYYMFHPDANPRGMTFREYTDDPDAMLDFQAQTRTWSRHNVIQDAELGPVTDGWHVNVDFQNYYEAAWLGCSVAFPANEVPDATPWLTDECKRSIFQGGLPDPFGGLMEKNLRYYEHFMARKASGDVHGLPILSVSPSAMGTDGPFTIACSIRGATALCLDLYEDPGFVHELLDFITEATISRIKAWRQYLGWDATAPTWGFADDSVQLLSTAMYKEFVLPYHRRLVSAFSTKGPNSIHLCGDATRHFPTLVEELNIRDFDTGFPVDFRALREELGPEVRISGGPPVEFLRSASPVEIDQEVHRILTSGVADGGRFILREGNNLAPGTPLENLKAMYDAGVKYGHMSHMGRMGGSGHQRSDEQT